ncbi:MAG: carboxy terminal-processing peptidase [Bacteroidota bacterium]
MKNKILIPLLVVGALITFFSFRYVNSGTSSAERKSLIIKTIMQTIKDGHYSARDINDSFSSKVYHRVLDRIDYEKLFFTQKDIDELKKYEFSLDDEINSGSIEFYEKMNGMAVSNLARAEKFYKEILDKPFSFDTDDSIQLSSDKLTFATDESALNARWYQHLKFRVLGKYVDLKKEQEKRIQDKDTSLKKIKTDAELETDARASIRKNNDSYFKRWHKIDENERFSIFYVECITNTEDPHTEYFPPQDKKRFDEMMSGAFFGIGAQLKSDDDGKVKIVSIITGSPCWKQGELKAGDEIVKVAQALGEPVDVQGFDIEDVVKLIRGEENTVVRLTVKRMDGSSKIIPIKRGKVETEETFAKSAIVNSKDGPVGYIYLREFYNDFQHANGRRCAKDVSDEVQKLKNAGVTGIVLDLRENGGGSLSDVVDMVGLFVGKGPVVQVKSNDAAPMTLSARNDAVLYDGPLAIMVNGNSASASEILAAAMQDYKRAVIVGATTYGKGTVQKVVSLDEFVDPLTRMKMQSNNEGPIGALKITIQKFYRINGGSTQLKGVTPDVALPDYQDLSMGERHDKSALQWDEIAPAAYTPSNPPINYNNIVQMSNARVANNPIFNLIKENATRIKKQEEDGTFSLNEAKYRKEVEEANSTSKKLEEMQKKQDMLTIVNPKEDMSRINTDSSTVKKNEDWMKYLKKDIYIAETVNIINDLSKTRMTLNMNTDKK